MPTPRFTSAADEIFGHGDDPLWENLASARWPPVPRVESYSNVAGALSMRIAYFHGQFIDEAKVSIAIDDPGFLWGATVTDRVRTYDRKLFRLSEHLDRFRRSCELCRIPQPLSNATLTEIAEELIAVNSKQASPGDEQVLILFATPGREKPTLCLHTMAFEGERYRALLTRGAKLITNGNSVIPHDCIPRLAKTRSRMHWWIAEQKVHDLDPEASVLFFDRWHVTETAAANFAVVRDGMVMTPKRGFVLDGISMRVVEEICGELGIPFAQRMLVLADCWAADEAFLTSTPYGIAPVSSINGKPIPSPGPVLLRIKDQWSRRLGVDLWRQILPSSPAC